jgi:hypothetical protein
MITKNKSSFDSIANNPSEKKSKCTSSYCDFMQSDFMQSERRDIRILHRYLRAHRGADKCVKKMANFVGQVPIIDLTPTRQDEAEEIVEHILILFQDFQPKSLLVLYLEDIDGDRSKAFDEVCIGLGKRHT